MTDNQAFRALFTLPPLAHSLPLAEQELPPVQNVTGDTEVDAVLWLHKVIETGSRDLIERAKQAAKRITTPMKELERRHNDLQRLRGLRGGTMHFYYGLGEFDRAAERAIEQADRRREALARFGTAEALFADQPAEAACKQALRGLKAPKDELESYDEVRADGRFVKRLDLTPHTLEDCLHARAYWKQLYWLRHAMEKWSGDGRHAAHEHDWFCLRSMGRLKPRSKEEALAVLEYAYGGDLNHDDQEPIMRNLVAGGWQ
jgi:hypothetical protein